MSDFNEQKQLRLVFLRQGTVLLALLYCGDFKLVTTLTFLNKVEESSLSFILEPDTCMKV